MTLWEIMRFGSMGLMTWFHLVPWFHGATVPFYYTCQMRDHTSLVQNVVIGIPGMLSYIEYLSFWDGPKLENHCERGLGAEKKGYQVWEYLKEKNILSSKNYYLSLLIWSIISESQWGREIVDHVKSEKYVLWRMFVTIAGRDKITRLTKKRYCVSFHFWLFITSEMVPHEWQNPIDRGQGKR